MNIIIQYSKLFKYLKESSNVEDNLILDILHESKPFIDLECVDNLESDEVKDYILYYQIPEAYISFLKYRKVDYIGMY